MIAQLVEQQRPDAVALQETRRDWRFEGGKNQGEQLAEILGYFPTVATGQVYFPILRVDEGLTILTRERPARTLLRELARLPLARRDENQRLCLGVELSVDARPVLVFDTHFSLSSAARLSNAMEVSAFVTEQAGEETPAFVMGDLNCAPHTPPIAHLTGSSEGQAPFVDCWVMAHRDEPGFTYSSWEPYHRIDYVLAKNMPESSAVRAEIIGGEAAAGVYPSDHLGILVDVEV
jgi:endonuclease/exonuclease/phosphatase family metal-dependent hydrolase